MPRPAQRRETAQPDVEQEEDDEQRQGPEDLPDDRPVDVDAARLATNIDEVLERLERELVGLVLVETRIARSPTFQFRNDLERRMCQPPIRQRPQCRVATTARPRAQKAPRERGPTRRRTSSWSPPLRGES